MEQWSVAQRTKIVELYFTTGSIVLAQRAFKRELRMRVAPSKSSILRYVERFREEGCVTPRKHMRTPTVRTVETIAAISAAIQRSPNRSVRRLSSVTGVSCTSVHRILTNDLHLFPYKIQTVQELKVQDVAQRLQFAETFLNMCEHDLSVIDNLYMSDEAHFHLSGYVNKQNCRFWAEDNPRQLHETPLHSQKVTVWCAISAQQIVGPYFFEEGAATVTVTAERYLRMLEDFFIPELRRRDVALDGVWFQQDGATCHTARISMAFLREHFPNKLISRWGNVPWPPRSPDLSAPDFFLWGYLKSKVYSTRPATLNDLKVNIQQSIADIPANTLSSVMNNVLVRCRECRVMGGRHLTNTIFSKRVAE